MAESRRLGFYAQQCFANRKAYGLLIVDLVNGFADPVGFGGGNLEDAIAKAVWLLAVDQTCGWSAAHSRILYAAALITMAFGKKMLNLELHPKSWTTVLTFGVFLHEQVR